MGEIDLDCDWIPDRTRTAARGAASELLACAALIKAGYYVYRCEAAAAPFDLVAYRDGRCLRVEVKTASLKDGTTYGSAIGWPKNDEWDLLVIVGPDRVFCFDSDTGWEEGRDVVREALGFRAMSPLMAVRPCGTMAGYKLHLDQSEDPDACPWCSECNRRNRENRRANNKSSVLLPALRRAR